jgi:hypothetical protein
MDGGHRRRRRRVIGHQGICLIERYANLDNLRARSPRPSLRCSRGPVNESRASRPRNAGGHARLRKYLRVADSINRAAPRTGKLDGSGTAVPAATNSNVPASKCDDCAGNGLHPPHDDGGGSSSVMLSSYAAPVNVKSPPPSAIGPVEPWAWFPLRSSPPNRVLYPIATTSYDPVPKVTGVIDWKTSNPTPPVE